MKTVRLLVIVSLFSSVLFAQKVEDPELRQKQAMHSHKSKVAEPTPANKAKSPPMDVAKIENSGVKGVRATHKSSQKSAAHFKAQPGSANQNRNKPLRANYRAPQRSNSVRAASSQSPKPH